MAPSFAKGPRRPVRIFDPAEVRAKPEPIPSMPTLTPEELAVRLNELQRELAEHAHRLATRPPEPA